MAKSVLVERYIPCQAHTFLQLEIMKYFSQKFLSKESVSLCIPISFVCPPQAKVKVVSLFIMDGHK